MLKDIAPKGTRRSVRRARRLRREMSLPEVLLWQSLRGCPGELKFRRQHPSGPYDLDFFCSDARLAIEVDGEAHDRGDRPQRDAAHDRWMHDKGIRTLRIAAVEVLNNLEGVLQHIAAEAGRRLPEGHPAKSSLNLQGHQRAKRGGTEEPGPPPLHQPPAGPPPPDKLREEF